MIATLNRALVVKSGADYGVAAVVSRVSARCALAFNRRSPPDIVNAVR